METDPRRGERRAHDPAARTEAARTETARTRGAPQVSGPQVSGPQVSGPQVSGPQVSGPQVSGPQVSGSGGGARRAAVRHAVRTLHPGYFALVMATGIVSVGLHHQGAATLSAALLVVAGGGWLLLLALLGWRVAAFRADLRRDLADPTRGFGFFTVVAGTDVLGVRLAVDGHLGAAAALLVVGGFAWLLLGYLVPWAAVLGRPDRPGLPGANGTWFIWVVATQSVAALAAVLQPVAGGGRRELAILAVLAWSVGVALYGAVGLFVAARLLLYRLRPADLTPPYWVAMGATAITVLAGAAIVRMADAPMIAVTRDLVAGVSVMFWAFGTWLIPALLAAGWWRHVVHRVPLRYEPTWWSIVFPLGMYAVAVGDHGAANHLPLVAAVSGPGVWVATAAWTVTAAAMLAHLWRTLVRGSPPPG